MRNILLRTATRTLPARNSPQSHASDQDRSQSSHVGGHRRRSALPMPSSEPVVRAHVDWQQALDSGASAVIEHAEKDAARAAPMRRPAPSSSFAPFHDRPHDLGWVGQNFPLVIKAQGMPEWVLIQPCAVVILRENPDCTIEHIERHGALFEYMQQQRDAALGYGGPNAFP